MSRPYQTYVISLPDAADRQAYMKSQLEDAGIAFEFLDGFDGRALNIHECDDYDSARRRRWFGRDLFGADIGCFRSHLIALKKAAESSEPHSVILEDDVHLDPKFWPIVGQLIELAPELDFVKFFGDKKTVGRGGRRLIEFDENISLVRLPSTPGGAHAYVVSREGARKLGAALSKRKITFPIDISMGRAWETGIDHLAVLGPKLALQNRGHPSMSAGAERFDKTIQLTGLQAALYPFWRALFRLSDAIGKRYAFYSRWPKDREIRNRARGRKPHQSAPA